VLSVENVELLQKMIPTEQEVKLYKDYVIEKKSINLLTEEDKFMLNLTKVERIASKLSIMNYMGNFFDSLHLISPVSSSHSDWLTCDTRRNINRLLIQTNN
jgi:formic-like protein